METDRYLEALGRRVLVFDGAMGTEVMALELDDADFGGPGHRGCNEALVLFRPDVVSAIHARYLEAGADVLETDSFTASRLKLDEYGLGARTIEVNRRAAELARIEADRFATAERPRFVAGSLGPTGMLISSSDPALSQITFDQLADIYGEQARALVGGGVDLLVIETSQDLLEMKAAIAGIAREFARGLRRVPIQAQATLDVTGRMLLGTDVRAVTATLDALPIDVIGLNCSTGPAHMRDAVRYLVENSRCFVAVIPNAGLPLMGPKGETIYPERPEEMANALGEFVREYGVNAIGGCCGTTPAHVRAFVEVARGRTGRPPAPKPLQLVASAMTATALVQDGSPLLIGERINAQGSRRIKRLLLADQYDEIVLVAREQVEGGAHVLDICTALTERSDEEQQMATVVKRLAQSVETPLMIDSTEPKVIEAALKIYAGRPIVNSVNLESGRVKLDAVMPLVVESGAAVVALTIDEQGMAKTAARKLEVAERIRAIVVGEYGVPAGALIFDALTFTLATGDPEFARSAVETIEGIRLIKARPSRRADVARRFERLVRLGAGGAVGPEFGHASSRGRGRVGHGDRQRQRDYAVRRARRARSRALRRPSLRPAPRRASAPDRALRGPRSGVARDGGGGRGRGRPGRGSNSPGDSAPAQGRDRGEDRRGPADARSGVGSQRSVAARDERGRRSLRLGRVDPAVRFAVGGSHEEGGRSSRTTSSRRKMARPRGRS